MRKLFLSFLFLSFSAYAVIGPFPGGTTGSSGGGGGGGGTPGGSSGQVQYNNSGAFGGFGSWSGTVLTVPNILDSGLSISQPVLSDASKNLVSGVIPTKYGGTNADSSASSGAAGVAQVLGGAWTFSRALGNHTTVTTQTTSDTSLDIANDAFVHNVVNAIPNTDPWQQIGGTGNPITQVDGTAPYVEVINDLQVDGNTNLSGNLVFAGSGSGIIQDVSNAQVMDPENRILTQINGSTEAFDFSGNGYDSAALMSEGVDFFSNPAVFINGVIADNSSFNTTSINVNAHTLNGFATAVVPVDYSTQGFNSGASESFDNDSPGNTYFSGSPVLVVQGAGSTPATTRNGALALTSTGILCAYITGTGWVLTSSGLACTF